MQVWITSENVSAFVREHGFDVEVDQRTLDLDGIEDWIWKALECVRSRVVVCEYMQGLGHELALTAPERPDFVQD